MSSQEATDGWDFTVPGEDADLAAEFRRHGVRSGQRVRVAVLAESEAAPAAVDEEALPSFFASFDGPPDLAERSEEILRAEFPRGR